MGEVTALLSQRPWGKPVCGRVRNHFSSLNVFIAETLKEAFDKPNPPTRLVFIGWGEKVPSELVTSMPCYCIHPSPLPWYRGGSPLQHQILEGERTSAVSLFRMTDEFDEGDLFAQRAFSLEHSLARIMDDITFASQWLVEELLKYSEPRPTYNQCTLPKGQTSNRRLTPPILSPEDAAAKSAREIQRIRHAWDDPYPRAKLSISSGLELELPKWEPNPELEYGDAK